MTDQREFSQPTGELIRILRTGAETDGAVFEFEATLPPKTSGPPAHRHLREVETFEVLSGRVSIRLGRDWREVEPGETVTVPPGTVHAFANRSDQQARLLTRETPAGQLEEQLRLLAASGRIPPVLELARINMAHDFSFAIAGVPLGTQQLLWRALGRLGRLRRN
jgi:mannose-6-phosphate isomerase-like protein (cupin superfamily)